MEPFLGEVRIFAVEAAPKGWARCDGQFLPINQNQALFALLGTTFGGNGQTTFQLPDLRGRVVMHEGSGHDRGEKAGSESVTLSVANLPMHTHTFNVNTGVGTATTPVGAVLAKAPGNTYGPPQNLVAMNPASSTSTGGGQAHQNMMPFLTLTFCIALQGLFPSQN